MNYVRPTPRPCPYCSTPVVHEYGALDARAYFEWGIVQRHNCMPEPPIPPNEKGFCSRCFALLAGGCKCTPIVQPKTAPAPPPAAAPIKEPPKKGGFSGGISI